MVAKAYFTPAQIDAILHRLECPDCIADALDADLSAVQSWCDLHASTLKAGGFITAPVTDLEREILADAVEGSTWAVDDADGTPQAHAGRVRALRAAAEKLRGLGVEIGEVPTA